MARRKSLEERIADRVAQRPPMKESKNFEHGPAKWIFASVLVFAVLVHFIIVGVVMIFGH
ncbi:hypothetical protein [Microbispora bryophytorum]|uniref:Uncharacterized protein n=1 Tax=Microbispora bryophytorum TaxID=1460882 RepID=A0A8H9LGS5_9ACTN|nr:hypothetical protein [Microbispora bryophytorum]MBD3140451.1 hypothetical protein [Microbispora bryophytorum]TQS02532.1 hypothetical protein FLX07_28600 [Microbispora bryophytorum]GGO27775.1 hypothetical protein GCM10011574_61470 [Microbispora bryophytorum]